MAAILTPTTRACGFMTATSSHIVFIVLSSMVHAFCAFAPVIGPFTFLYSLKITFFQSELVMVLVDDFKFSLVLVYY